MWIDFPPNPSIITGTWWKPTSRRRPRPLGSSDRSGVSPSHSEYLFFLWLGAAQLWGHFMCQSPRSHSPLHFKAWLRRHCRMWRGGRTHEKCPNRKMLCRSNYQRLKRRRRKWDSCAWKHKAVDTDSPWLLCALCALYVWRLANEWGKKAAVHGGWQKINAGIWSVLCCLFFIFIALFSKTIGQVAYCCSRPTRLHFHVLMLLDPCGTSGAVWALLRPIVLRRIFSPLFAAFLRMSKCIVTLITSISAFLRAVWHNKLPKKNADLASCL